MKTILVIALFGWLVGWLFRIGRKDGDANHPAWRRRRDFDHHGSE
jgi:hypothetical protein